MRDRQAGSALIESLVAAAIVMISLSTMYQAFAESARRTRISGDKSMALLVAQSQLATVGAIIPAESGRTTGSEGPYNWEIDVAPSDAGGVTLDAVTVRVGARGKPGSLVTLQTLRVHDAE